MGDLIQIRRELLDRLAVALELQLRLLHSTEANARTVATEHDAFCSLLDSLAAHGQRPHIQRFSALNRDEFERAEYEYLRQFRERADERCRHVAEILLVDHRTYAPDYSYVDLIERMLEARRAGAANQFSEAHRSTVRALLDPRRYYGPQIAMRFFTGEEPPAGEPDDTIVDTAADEHDVQQADDTDESFLRMKSDVIADSLRHYHGVRTQVLATVLIKVKSWLQLDGHEPRLATSPSGTVGLDVLSTDPRKLVFSYLAESGVRALVTIGVSNEPAAGAGASSGLPSLSEPNVSLVLYDPSGAVAGSAFVAGVDEPGSPLERLALLIKKLDFAPEYLHLTSLAEQEPSTAAEAGHEEAEKLLNLAMEL